MRSRTGHRSNLRSAEEVPVGHTRNLRKKNFKVESSESDLESSDCHDPGVIELMDVFALQVESVHSFLKENDANLFYVKLRNLSFKQCRWMNEEEIIAKDPSAKGKLSRFLKEKGE